MIEGKHWYSWVIKRNRFENVIQYIKDEIPEVDKYFYPLIKKEYISKSGSRIKDRPLYEGYLFLHYEDSAPLYHKISANPFITTYAGVVTEEEMERMQQAQGKLISEVKASRFSEGETIRLLSGPFKGLEGKVTRIEGSTLNVAVAVEIFGHKQLDMVFSEDQIEKLTTLENVGVQVIGT